MMEPVPSRVSNKLVVGQQSNKLRKAERKKRNTMAPWFGCKFMDFLDKTTKVSLTLCQIRQRLQDTLLTKLLG